MEIRLKIWREALPGPRVIDVIFDTYSTITNEERVEMQALRANQPPPVIQHVCHESRQETFRFYSQIGNAGSDGEINDSYAFLDLSKDTLYMQQTVGLGKPENEDQEFLLSGAVLADETFKRLKYLAIDKAIWWECVELHKTLWQFESLLELAIVVHDPRVTNEDFRHETWRMKSTHIELVEVTEYWVGEHLKQDLAEIIEETKRECPEWKEPKFVFKTIVRGGRQCCFANFKY